MRAQGTPTQPAEAEHAQARSTHRGLEVARRVLLALLAVLVGAAVYLANASGLLHNALPMPFGWGLATVESGSMEPSLSKGDLLVVRAASGADVGVRDVVVYRSATGSLVVHRVVARDGGTLTIQGDANDSPDAPVDESQVLAVAVGRVPGAGAAVDALRTPAGIAVLVVLALLLVEVPFRRHRRADAAERKRLMSEIASLKAQQQGRPDDWREW